MSFIQSAMNVIRGEHARKADEWFAEAKKRMDEYWARPENKKFMAVMKARETIPMIRGDKLFMQVGVLQVEFVPPADQEAAAWKLARDNRRLVEF